MTKHVLQVCHGYDAPFLDVARQYSALFSDTDYRVTTVFLTGPEDPQVTACLSSDEVIFLQYLSKDLRGLKLKQIQQVKEICHSRRFSYAIAHRYKAIYICLHVKDLFVIGVHHAFWDYLLDPLLFLICMLILSKEAWQFFVAKNTIQ